MSESFWVAVVASIPALIASLSAAVIGIITAFKVEKVHKQINSRMDQLLTVTASASKAEGVKEELDRIK